MTPDEFVLVRGGRAECLSTLVVIRRPQGGNRKFRCRALTEEFPQPDPPLGGGACGTDGPLARPDDADFPDMTVLARGERRAVVRFTPDNLGAPPVEVFVIVESADVEAGEVVRDLRLGGEEPEDIVPIEVDLWEAVFFFIREFNR